MQTVTSFIRVDHDQVRLETFSASLSQNAIQEDPQPPLLLLHGLGCSSETWKPSLRWLHKMGFLPDALAPDFPGCGRSECSVPALGIDALADWTVRLLEALGIEKADVAGNSMGAQVALAIARRHPERAHSLILLGPSTGHGQVTFWRYAAGLLLDGFGESWSYNLLLLRMYTQMGLTRFLATTHALMEDDPMAEIEKVQCPVLVLRGGHDRIISENMAQELAAALPHGEYQALDSTAHAAEYNTPDLFVSAVLEFLSRVRNSEMASLPRKDKTC